MSGLESLSREDLLALIAVQQRTIEELKARVVELERRLGRNSGNSNMPPSSDVFTKPAKPRPAAAPRRRGKRPGAPGAGLALVEDPDEVVEVFAPACRGCGGRPDVHGSLGFVRRQYRDVVGADLSSMQVGG